ncbi:MAG: pyridoxamine 5'-phosphate oxidase family protein [Solirubrobacteraceae bacterium]
MSPALAAFLGEPLVAVIGTQRRDGRIALTPVWFEYRDQRLWLNSFESAQWHRRVQRTGRATVLVIDPADTLRTAHIDCELEAVQRDGAREHIDALAQRYLGDRYQGPHQARLILVLAPTQISSAVG